MRPNRPRTADPGRLLADPAFAPGAARAAVARLGARDERGTVHRADDVGLTGYDVSRDGTPALRARGGRGHRQATRTDSVLRGRAAPILYRVKNGADQLRPPGVRPIQAAVRRRGARNRPQRGGPERPAATTARGAGPQRGRSLSISLSTPLRERQSFARGARCATGVAGLPPWRRPPPHDGVVGSTALTRGNA